jgi:hypothetical protein
MTTATYRTPQQIAALGFQALVEGLGPGGALEFIHQCERGQGNYTEERRGILRNFRLESLKPGLARRKPAPGGR